MVATGIRRHISRIAGRNHIVKAHLIKPDGTLSVTIPKVIREKLGIVKGTELIAYEENGVLNYEPLDMIRKH